jgi:archaellum component FlaF (FlaF/FlaG flagellin family)
MEIQNNVISLTNVGAGYTDPANTLVTISAPDVGSDQATLGLTIANNGTSNVVSSVYVVHPGFRIHYNTYNYYFWCKYNTATAVVFGETSPKVEILLLNTLLEKWY